MTSQTVDRISRKTGTVTRLIVALGIALSMAGSAEAGLFDKLNQKNPVKTLVKKASKAVPKQENLLKKLVDQVDPSKLVEMLKMTKSAVDFVISEKKKLDAWQKSGGGEATRSRLESMVDDIGVTEKSLHQLTCAVAPNRPPFSESKQQQRVKFMKTLINAAPKPLLWAADSAFSLAIGENWGGLIGETNTMLEPIASRTGELCELGDKLRDSKAFELARCDVMRAPVFEELERVGNVTEIASNLIKFANNFVKDDIVVTAGATVAAGGSAGTNIKNPTKALLSSASSELDKIQKVIGKISNRRGTCAKRDEKIERDLMSCNALVSYDTDDYAFVQDLAQRRYDALYANGLNQTHIPWSSFEGAPFLDICDQYQDLRFGRE